MSVESKIKRSNKQTKMNRSNGDQYNISMIDIDNHPLPEMQNETQLVRIRF